MSEDAGGSPKTLADVSHLFFSKVEKDAGAAADAPAVVSTADACAPDPRRAESVRRTRFIVVTGGSGAPGKSTVAVNIAQALTAFGRVGVFDADPRIPNARFYLGLPSWHYLSPLTGEGEAAPNALTDTGVAVADWSVGDSHAAGTLEAGGRVRLPVRDFDQEAVDLAVVDVPATRTGLLGLLGARDSLFVIVSGPGLREFERAYWALRELKRAAGVRRAALVVSRVSDANYAQAFHAKLESVARRLLSMEVVFLGGVPVEAGLGAAQRGRGPIVAARPGSTAALVLREIASRALETAGGRGA